MKRSFEKTLSFKNKGTVSSILVLIVLLAALVFVFGCEDKKEEVKPRKEKKTEEAKKVEASDALKAKATEMVETYGCIFKDGTSLETKLEIYPYPEGVISSVVTGEPGSQTLFVAYWNEDWDKRYETLNIAVFKERDGTVKRLGTVKANEFGPKDNYWKEEENVNNIIAVERDGKEYLLIEEAEMYEGYKWTEYSGRASVKIYGIGDESLEKVFQFKMPPVSPEDDEEDGEKEDPERSAKILKELEKLGFGSKLFKKDCRPKLNADGDAFIARNYRATDEELEGEPKESGDDSDYIVKYESGGRVTDAYKKVKKSSSRKKDGSDVYAEYRDILLKSKHDILDYESNLFEHRGAVAFYDVNGDGIPELLFMGMTKERYGGELKIYTIIDGKAVRVDYEFKNELNVQRGKEFVNIFAGAGVRYMIYTGPEPGSLYIDARFTGYMEATIVLNKFHMGIYSQKMNREYYLQNHFSYDESKDQEDEYFENGQRVSLKYGMNAFSYAYSQRDKVLLFSGKEDTSLWKGFKEKDALSMPYRDAVLYCNKHMEK